jgi:ribosomal protein S6--L-glutamate ligase
MIGWREWAALPALGINKIKVKVDTGARTSALDARNIQRFKRRGKSWIRFDVYPAQRSKKHVVHCEAELTDIRTITDSGGHKERRYVIRTPFKLAEQTWDVEISLTCRSSMGFRMLLGRAALQHHVLIDPMASFLSSDKPINPRFHHYQHVQHHTT